jgi:uncharacterized membrane protein YedE/YeeE
MTATPRRYWNPYAAGVALGLVLLSAFALVGRGIGVSGAAAAVVATGVDAVAPAHARANPYFDAYLGDGSRSPLGTWIVVEVAGVLLGGLLSAVLARRFRPAVERGPRAGVRGRLAYALAGGAIMGFGTRLARGCTSGLALTGGALLSVGAWVFMLALFAAGYAVAPLVRRQWT